MYSKNQHIEPINLTDVLYAEIPSILYLAGKHLKLGCKE